MWEMEEKLVLKDPFTAFGDFYRDIQGRELNEEEWEIMKQIFEKVKGE